MAKEHPFPGRQSSEQHVRSDTLVCSDGDGMVIEKSRGKIGLDAFLKAYGRTTGTPGPSVPQLTYPIVISQRRPGVKERGFIEAYAPVLQQYGIDEKMWLDFLKLFNKAMQHNKWLCAIQLAAAGSGFVPNGIAMGVSIAVQFIAFAVAQAESKWRTNSFLDRVNNEFFRPRGLFCLLMSYKPVTYQIQSKPDESTAVFGSTYEQTGSFRDKVKKNLRDPVAATVEGEQNLPNETAELVYSNKQKLVATATGQHQHKNAGTRLKEYLDRRAQAKYARESKNDVLSNPDPGKFKHRYLDPNSKASRGGLIGLVSGGLLVRDPDKVQAQIESQYRSQEAMLREQQASVIAQVQQYNNVGFSQEQHESWIKQYQDAYDMQLNALKQQLEVMEKGEWDRRITKDILYILVVNMPSDFDMDAARQHLRAGSTEGDLFASHEI